jgi:branched-chain amino acid aminotransferase
MTMVPMDERQGWIWLDGRMVPWQDAKIHFLTHGLHYGSAVFEGERAYGGRVFHLERHGRRLANSAAIMDMALPFEPAAIDAAAAEVVRANGLKDAYVRRLAWRGSEQIMVGAPGSRIHVAVAAWTLGTYFDPEAKLQGIRLAMADWRRPPPECIPCKAKASGLYMICTLSRHAAERAGYADALMLDWRGQVAEATGANVFFVEDGALHTPVPDCFLDGITRQTVIGLARRRGVEVVERTIMPAEIAGFDGCFLTGSAAEITAVGEIAGTRFPVPALVRQLAGDYTALVRAEGKEVLSDAA